MKRRGFSVIELIIVLATVGLLASIFYGVYATKVLPSRHRESCRGKVRQLSLAIKQYLRDNNDTFPLYSSAGKHYGWADSIEPYFKESNLLQCSAEPTRPADGDGPKTRNYTDYFYNANLSGENEAALQYIASTAMLADAVPGDARHVSRGPIPKGSDTSRIVDLKGKPIGAATRHLGGANYALADGHVAWLKGSDANTTPTFRRTNGFLMWTFEIN